MSSKIFGQQDSYFKVSKNKNKYFIVLVCVSVDLEPENDCFKLFSHLKKNTFPNSPRIQGGEHYGEEFKLAWPRAYSLLLES